MSEIDRYDYELPRELIAQHPLPRRSDARLMLVDRARQTVEHHHVRDLPELLTTRDTLVINDTRVIPARLVGRRTLTGGAWEGLFLSVDAEGLWHLLGTTRGKLRSGETVTLSNRQGQDDVLLRLIAKEPGGVWLAKPETAEATYALLDRIGWIPLPHYIRDGCMNDEDVQRYQTVFAKHRGSVAAPTAGLHFTDDLLGQIQQRGVEVEHVTLHVGMGTFRPISTDTLAEHAMHGESAAIDAATVERLRARRAAGGRIVAVGTTSVRTLESAAAQGELQPWSGTTHLFIRPPYSFRAVDALMTNFHLPRTTLLVLVTTFGGYDLIMRAYREAIAERYRLFSYGDAMLIV